MGFLKSRPGRTRRLLVTRIQGLEPDEVNSNSLHKSQLISRDRVEDVASTIAEGDHILLLDDLLDGEDGAFHRQVFEGNHVRLVVNRSCQK